MSIYIFLNTSFYDTSLFEFILLLDASTKVTMWHTKVFLFLESYNTIIFIFDSRTGDGNLDPTETDPGEIIIFIVLAVVVVVVIVLVLVIFLIRKRRGESKSRGKHVFI